MIEKVYRVSACEQIGYASTMEEAQEMEKRFRRNYGSCSYSLNADGTLEVHSRNDLGEEYHSVTQIHCK